ncbi:signal peptidase I (plasmid) [Paenibacillus thiaminolyticus]|uniref:signal peptidase I n=1 Tax=Paenibacillus thiaminolyticus TaxID=49283 RepID=UPI00232C13FE|nr:signal peptidase I [Paenibacillus thiaminolyticus]WCF11426.1 signal peptidase I [Paenibacillus thiaminolyticus]
MSVYNKNSQAIVKEFVSWIKIFVISLVIGVGISYVIKPTVVFGESMAPTLEDGNFLILNRLAYKFGEPEYKDIVVFHSNLPGDRILIKRVIATEGQQITVKDGKVHVDDNLVEEDSYIYGVSTFGDFSGTVPQGSVFVMGDNRVNSIDSRSTQVGFVGKQDIIGKVMIRLYPLSSLNIF